ncbi:MAG: response regulator [Alphaproteobacteria bacterium]|nr:response regulator [Alphaproteobacteria bacterium]
MNRYEQGQQGMNTRTFYDRVDLLLVSPRTQNSASLRQTLADLEFREIRTASSNADILKALETRPPELMITEFDLPDGDIHETINDIRHHRVGANPFMSIIVTTWQPSEALVHQVLDAGADDLLVQPASRGQLAKRIETLVFNRKPFVVTSNYIGPDRRNSARPGTQKIEGLDVPNILQSKVMGGDESAASQNALDAAIAKVNLDKIIRNGAHIGYLTKQILSAYEQKNVDGPLVGHLRGLISTGEDSIRRIRGTKYELIKTLFQTIITVGQRLELAFNSPEGKDLQLLPELAMSIRLALKDGGATGNTADQISAAISGALPQQDVA